MIRIARGAEPLQLRQVRRKHLARAILAWSQGRAPEFEDYSVAREVLWRAQGMKCAYCERHQGLEGQPVEHFRPKNGTARDEHQPTLLDRDYYWWLAWSWENLIFSCVTCNSPRNKGNTFPLGAGTVPLELPSRAAVAELPAACFDLSSESAVLLDPTREEPLDHIEWRPENPRTAREEDFLWRPIHLTERGRRTIQILGFRGGLVDQVNGHIRRNVLRPVQRIWREVECGDLAEARAEWDILCRALLIPSEPYQAAAFNALTYLVPLWFRQQWNLAPVQRPGQRDSVSPSPDLADPPGLDGLPDEARLHIRADDLETGELLCLFCSHRDWDPSELAAVLDRTISTIRQCLKKLERDGRVERIAGRFRSPQLRG